VLRQFEFEPKRWVVTDGETYVGFGSKRYLEDFEHTPLAGYIRYPDDMIEKRGFKTMPFENWSAVRSKENKNDYHETV